MDREDTIIENTIAPCEAKQGGECMFYKNVDRSIGGGRKEAWRSRAERRGGYPSKSVNKDKAKKNTHKFISLQMYTQKK